MSCGKLTSTPKLCGLTQGKGTFSQERVNKRRGMVDPGKVKVADNFRSEE